MLGRTVRGTTATTTIQPQQGLCVDDLSAGVLLLLLYAPMKGPAIQCLYRAGMMYSATSSSDRCLGRAQSAGQLRRAPRTLRMR